MREKEMRLRVFRYLKARMQNMIMPATVGIGLAVAGGCTDSSAVALYSAPAYEDAAAVKQDVPANPDSVRADVASLADLPANTTPDGPGAADALLADAATDENALDAHRPDGATDVAPGKDGSPFDGGILDTQSDGAPIVSKYIAQMPDAATDSATPVARYMAVMPDASPDRSVVALYMAALPS